MNLSVIGGRRFLITFASMICTTLLTAFGKLDASAYTMVTIATVGALIAGNTTQHVTSIKTPNSTADKK